MSAVRMKQKPARNPWAEIAPAAAVLVAVYLWAWAWRWPHSDMRNTGAIMLGCLVVVIGVSTGIATWRRHGTAARLLVIPSLVAIGIGLLGLSGVSDGQADACGDELSACSSLLPGI